MEVLCGRWFFHAPDHIMLGAGTHGDRVQNDDPDELEYSPSPSQALHTSVPPWLFCPGSQSTCSIRNAGKEAENITCFPASTVLQVFCAS